MDERRAEGTRSWGRPITRWKDEEKRRVKRRRFNRQQRGMVKRSRKRERSGEHPDTKVAGMETVYIYASKLLLIL